MILCDVSVETLACWAWEAFCPYMPADWLIVISLLALSHKFVPKTSSMIIISSYNPRLGLFFSKLVSPSGCRLTGKSHKDRHSDCCINIASFPSMGGRGAWGKSKASEYSAVDMNWNPREFATLLACWRPIALF